MKRLYTFLLAAVMVLSLAACGGQASSSSSGSDASSGDSAAEMPTVGFVSASWADDYCKRLSDALVELGPEYGLNVDAINGAPSGSPDVSGYIEAIDALASKNPDAMIVQPLFSVPDHCVQFNEKGIPLTFLNLSLKHI